MNERPEPGGGGNRSQTGPTSPPTAPDRRLRRRRAEDAKIDHLDLISCDGCGRTFVTSDGPGMMAAIVGPCPDCGGRFQLSESLPRGMRP
jgi:hypothetical protein